jgi:hypothetical protein
LSDKSDLVAFTGRCASLVQNETDLLTNWASELSDLMMIGRAARCRLAANAISMGAGSPLWRVQNADTEATDTAETDVKQPPTPQQISAQTSCESDYYNRKNLDPSGLSDDAFSRCITGSRGNAARSSSLAESTLAFCTAS